MRQTRWKDYLDEWEHKPIGALAWIQKRLLDAGITAKDEVSWSIYNGMFVIATEKFLKEQEFTVSTKPRMEVSE